MRFLRALILFIGAALTSYAHAEVLGDFVDKCLDGYIFNKECAHLIDGSDERRESFLGLAKSNLIYFRFKSEYLNRFSQANLEEFESIVSWAPWAPDVSAYNLVESLLSMKEYHGPKGDILVFREAEGEWRLDADASKIGTANADSLDDVFAVAGAYALALEWMPHYYSSLALNMDAGLVMAALVYESVPNEDIQKHGLEMLLRRAGMNPLKIRQDALDAFHRFE
ncbi:MAG: hypothetical protein LAT61_09185 [Alcanivorax sp.]|nr:hypothetical protein [Alcanivorax sp.]